MSRKNYAHWNEEADLVWLAEDGQAMRDGSPTADMTDDEIKEAVYGAEDDYFGDCDD